MQPSREEVLSREQRWALPAALSALAAIGLVVAAVIVSTQAVGTSDGESELLRNVDAHQTAHMISSVLQAIAAALLAVPLLYLFRAAQARSDRVRGQLVGVVVAAPLFLALAAILNGISTVEAAGDFVSNEVPRLMAKGIALDSDRANDLARDAILDAPLGPLSGGFQLGGRLGFTVAMFYTAMHGMRTGLLTRFWGSLGMALGVISFIPAFSQFALLWFIYLGLLFAGRLRGGRPPAWAAGEAIPWPTPGEAAAAKLDEGEEQESPDELEPGDADEKRKRKQRT